MRPLRKISMPFSRPAPARLGAAVVLALALAVPATATAQSYPIKTIRIISPFSPGSPPDATARLIAQQLASRLGQSVTVENRPGAGSTIATRAGATAEPDGYTLLQVNASLAYASVLYPNPGYDPLKSFSPVAPLASWSLLLVVPAGMPADTIPDFIAHAKANPGGVNIGFPLGTPPHVLAEMLKSATGAPLNGVPYRQVSQLIADLVAGRVQALFSIAPGVVSLVKQGKLKALAYTGVARHPALPQVPTVIESGLPELALNPSDWVGIVAPAGTPPEAIKTLNAAINASLASPEVKTAFAKLGWETKIATPQEFATFLAAEAKKWPPLVKKAGLKPN
jgi:tripartite-type tricarboxylate transporter receptor subunit TctC